MGLFGRDNIEDGLKEEKTLEQVEKEAQERRNNMSSTLRLLAGGYLCYLAYDIARNLLGDDPGAGGGPAWLMWLSVVAFGAIGAGLIVNYLIKYYRERRSN